jgi:hypothetical protein
MTNRAAADRERYRRLSTEESGATRFARVRFLSASKVFCPNPKRFRAFRRAGSLSAICQIISDRRVNQRFVQFDAENGIGQFDIADFFILQITNLYGCHNSTPYDVKCYFLTVNCFIGIRIIYN